MKTAMFSKMTLMFCLLVRLSYWPFWFDFSSCAMMRNQIKIKQNPLLDSVTIMYEHMQFVAFLSGTIISDLLLNNLVYMESLNL